MKWRFWHKVRDVAETAEDVVEQVVEDIVSPIQPELEYRTVVIRPTKWVTWNGLVGVVVSMDASGYVVVHETNAIGETVKQHRINGGMLQLARLQQIPESRRPTDVAYAATLGYV